MKKVLVTGAAGFIGFHLCKKLISENFEVIGLDVINDYYDIELKYNRLNELGIEKLLIKENKIINSSINNYFKFIKADLSESNFIIDFMKSNKFTYVINLAAQAGVRYSIDNPNVYTKSNVDGFLSILQGARFTDVKHLIYASTSSVYGLNSKMPLNESMPTEHPMALYAATKKANEMMAHSYSHLFDLPTTGLRFFTVYGPWGRPDMALFLFADGIIKQKEINLFNYGNMIRDFTYIDDIVESIHRLMSKPPKRNQQWDTEYPEINSSSAPYKIFNIGNGKPVKVLDFIKEIEINLNKKAIIKLTEIQPGDVPSTHADTKSLNSYIDFIPNTNIKYGISEFIEWYLKYYKISI